MKMAFSGIAVILVSIGFTVIPTKVHNQYDEPIIKRKIIVYTTAEGTKDRLSATDTFNFSKMDQPLETQVCVFVDPDKKFQTILGFGGAITDAAAETFYQLPESAQKELLNAYYNPIKGIGYTMARTNINSCDFSSDSYTYVANNDSSLSTFSIAHDKTYKIPFIKAATKVAQNQLHLFVSPWSPPAWMKDNNSMVEGGHLKNNFRKAWAQYYIKFIKAYEADGIPVWGLTVQNEPMAKQTWESCIYSAEAERDFVKYFLGPALQRNSLAEKKLIIWDHNRDLLYQRASTILNDPEAAKYVWGIGYHWYETWTGSGMEFLNEQRVHEAYPNKNLIFTEGCIEKFSFDRIYDWSLGERYGHSLINDFNNGTIAWTDWNILLNEKGGPNHVGNFCFAPIHADTRTGKLMYTNSYYYLGQFSKFVHPGAKRIISSSNRDQLETTAFENKDGSLAVIVMNSTSQSIQYHLWIHGNAATIVSLPHSIATLVINK
ncbi:MAG: glycoside hydrolase family 30 protein [Bacteroidota bacterium]|jgi:glucosylceramidase|nr:glycoside hydrolase family 30 protein [Bacteroidota bacterium]